MPLRMSMCFTSSKQVYTNTNTNTNTTNIQDFKSSSYMNLNQLKKSKGCSACSDN